MSLLPGGHVIHASGQPRGGRSKNNAQMLKSIKDPLPVFAVPKTSGRTHVQLSQTAQVTGLPQRPSIRFTWKR